MMPQQHPDLEQEKRYLAGTIQELDRQLKRMEQMSETYAEEIKDSNARRMILPDSSQEYIDLMIGTALLDYSTEKAIALKNISDAPYFARIDFRDMSVGETRPFYIGKTSIIQDPGQKILVTDWRAPVANLYYEGRIGYNSYAAPEGLIHGDLSLKRQYVIRDRELQTINDVDLVTNDDLLASCLEGNATNRLKDIVGTIQAEQNQIIRYDLWKSMLIQGAAGAGKTTVALHRIAYLLYTYNGTIGGDNFLILGPNRFFLNYISSVLPDLGVGEVAQHTFEDFAEKILGRKLKIQDQHEKLKVFLDDSIAPETKTALHKESVFKSSQRFIDICDRYIRYLEENYLPKEDLLLVGQILMPYEELQDLFIHTYHHLPFEKRIQEMKKHIKTRLDSKKKSIQTYVENRCMQIRNQFASRMKDGPERQAKMRELYDKRDEMLLQLEQDSKKLIAAYVKTMPKKTGFEYYRDLFTEDSLFEAFIRPEMPENAAFIRDYTMRNLGKNHLELEDLPPAMLIQVAVKGLAKQEGIRHIVIDEAQDLSLFQFSMLRKIFPTCTFTILGDLYQGIHSYRSITDWKPIEALFLSNHRDSLKVLRKSYRTTVEIIASADPIMQYLNMDPAFRAVPFLRHGAATEYLKLSRKSMIDDIIKKCEQVKKEKGFGTFALITVNQKMADLYYKELRRRGFECQKISEENDSYQGGFSVLPTYLAKGMEFDQVFLADVDDQHYPLDDIHGKLLYVAMTRALHGLVLYSENGCSSFLNIE